MKDLTIVKRYAGINRKPFTTMQFVEASGYRLQRAIRTLNRATREGILNYLGGTGEFRIYVPVPPNNPRYHDFTPDRAKLISIHALLSTTHFLHWTNIVEASGMGKRTVMRYLEMLVHLGCADTQKAPGGPGTRRGSRKKLYRALCVQIPPIIPPYHRTINRKWRTP